MAESKKAPLKAEDAEKVDRVLGHNADAPAAQAKADKIEALGGVKVADLELGDTDLNDPESVGQLQHPSLVGREQVEIAARAQDVDEKQTDTYEKVYVVRKSDYDARQVTGDWDEFHADNIRATRQFAVQVGLRPIEDGQFIGAETHKVELGGGNFADDKTAMDLRYGVKVRVAVSLTEAQEVGVRLDPKDPVQHLVDQGVPALTGKE